MKNKKKFIALLAMCCTATAVAALVGCGGKDGADGVDGLPGADGAPGINGVDGAPGKSAYEIAVENGYTGTEAEFAALLTHEHDYTGDVIVIKEPTGVSEGVGYKVCEADGAVTIVSIPVLKGVVAENPIELTIGEPLSVKVNDYDSDKYGVSVDSGEKGVMYFKTTVENASSALLSLQAEADVEFAFYSSDEYVYSSSRLVNTGNVLYIKATFASGFGETVEISSKTTATVGFGSYADGYIANTVTLSQEVATGLKLYEYSSWSDAWYEVDDSAQCVKNEDGSYTVYTSGDSKYKLGVGEGYYLSNKETDLIIEHPADGSKDTGCEIALEVGAIEAWAANGTTYSVLSAGKAMATITLEEAGKYTFLMHSDNPDFGYSSYRLTVNGVPQGDYILGKYLIRAYGKDTISLEIELNEGVNEIELDSASGCYDFDDIVVSFTKAVEVVATPVELNAETTVVLDTTYKFTATKAGTYKLTFTVESLIDMQLYSDESKATLLLDGADLNNFNLPTEYTVELAADGVFTFCFVGVVWQGSVCDPGAITAKLVEVQDEVETSSNVLALETANQIASETTYSFTAEVAGSYTFVVSGDDGYCVVAESGDMSSTLYWDPQGGTYDEGNKQAFTLTFTEGETKTFWANGNMTITISRTDAK